MAKKKFLSRKKTIIGIGLTFLLLMGIFFFAYNATRKEPLQTESDAANTNTSLILKIQKDSLTSAPKIVSAQAVVGGLVADMPPKAFTKDKFPDQVEQVINGKVVSSRPIAFSNKVEGLPPKPGIAGAKGDKPYQLAKYETTVEMKYVEGASFQIRNIAKNTVQTMSASIVATALTKPIQAQSSAKTTVIYDKGNFVSKQFSTTTYPSENNGTLDILYISSHYTDYNLFANDVQAMASFLLSVPPFSEKKNNIRILRLDNPYELGCKYAGGFILCDSFQVYGVASVVAHDTIIVVENGNTYGGGAIHGSNIAVTYRNVADLATHVALHEMGHSFGFLQDEYDQGLTYTGTEYLAPNCDASSSCQKWSGTAGTGCFQVCGFTNAYRPTYNECIMRDITRANFDPIDSKSLRNLIDAYLTVGPTPTTPPPTYPYNTYIPIALGTQKVSTTTYQSAIQLQNPNNINASVVLKYYSQDGREYGIPLQEYILANSSKNFYAPAGLHGSIVVNSSQPLKSIGNILGNNNTIGGSFTGITSGESKMYLPLIMCNNGGYDTWFNVQNVDINPATIRVSYKPGSAGIPGFSEEATIAPGAAKTFSQKSDSPTINCNQIGPRFVGSVIVESTNSQRIAAVVNEVNSSSLLTYNGFSGGSTKINLPLVNTNNNGITTGVQVQNIGSTSTTVSGTVYCAGTSISLPQYTLTAGASQTYRLATPLITFRCVGSAIFTGSQPLVAIVNQVSSISKIASAYESFSSNDVGTRQTAPLLMANNGGYNTAVQCQNVGTSSTTITVSYFQNAVGSFVPQPVTVSLNPQESQTIAQRGDEYGTTRYVGGATITSSGQPIACIVNQLGSNSSVDQLLTYKTFKL